MQEQEYRYARFWKCALQVNSHEYSKKYRGQDHGLDANSYAEELKRGCFANEIKIIGLADHGSVEEQETIRKVLGEADIVVFPGFEVATTEKIHWICLYSEDTKKQKLERYLGELKLTNPREGVRPSELSGRHLLNIVEEQKGFCFAAHVTSNNGVLKGKFNNLWNDNRLRAAQIPGSINNLPPNYKKIVLNQDPEYKRALPMALLNACDVAKPKDLSDQHASCCIKMTRPCFSSFLMAFKDVESRVRLADDRQERFYSQIESITIEGGYLDSLSARFSGHLNAVIGGRGTGKSTLLECLRYALDVPHKGEDAKKQGDQIVKENLGKAGGRVVLKLRSSAHHMNTYKVVRRFGEPPRVVDKNENVSSFHPGKDLLPNVEIYGQNEIVELAKDPSALVHILDRFLPERADQQSKLESIYRKLRENTDKLVKAHNQKEEYEMKVVKLPKLEEQVRLFKEQGLEDNLKQVPLIEKERQLGQRILEEIELVRTGQRKLEETIPELVFLSDKELEGLPHVELIKQGRKQLNNLRDALEIKLNDIVNIIDETEVNLKRVVSKLNEELIIFDEKITAEFGKLPQIAGKDGAEIGRSYQQLLREVEQVNPIKNRLRITVDLVKELEQERRNLLGEISDIRSVRTNEKQSIIKKLNEHLSGKLRITIVPDGLRKPLLDFLKELPGVGEKKTDWVNQAENITVLGLVAAIREGKEALMNKKWGLTPGTADILCKMSPELIYELESIDVKDQVKLELNVAHDGKKFRSLSNLSTGQQCTAILHLLLLKNRDPLIMDQPEDNLDNAFIAERIVEELRTAKIERQFLFATHNANIPVFGDAEWIGVCSVLEGRANISEELQGSIDIPEIRNQVAKILEGGKKAFLQRKEKYGFDY